MTDVPSKHVWKIKESRIVFKDFGIIAVVPTLKIIQFSIQSRNEFEIWRKIH